MRTYLRGKITLLFMMLGLLIAIPAVALAAELVTAEVDVGTPATPNEISVEQGGSKALPISLTATGPISCAITSTNPAQAKVFKTYSFTKNATTSAVELSSTDLSDPVNFYSNGIAGGGPNCGTTWDTNNVVNATVSAAANVPTGTYTIALVDTNDPAYVAPTSELPSDTAVSNPSASGGKLGDTTKTSIKVNVVAPANQAPSVPGTPGLASGSNTPNQGTFGLTWTASTDDGKPTGSSVTYTLQHKDANDATFSNVATGISGNSYAFGSGSNAAEAEGTWTYQVKASDGTLESAFSAASSAIKVDKSDPYDPTFSAGTPYYTAPSGDEWYKNSATVQFSQSTTTTNGDRDLADTSAGSGVASISTTPANTAGAITFSTSGTHTFSGRTVDVVGRQSCLVPGSVKVDATDPVVNITDCPTTDVIKGSSHSIAVSASDAHSGLKTDPSDATVELNTGTTGEKTVSFEAVDNVDRNNTASCTYNVIFDWSGFFRPVDNPDVVNSAKAGSTIPVKFSLGGDQGLNIFWTQTANVTYPNSGKLAFDQVTGDPVDALEEYSTATVSGLKYDSTANQYIYNWKTDKNWAGTYRQLIIRLADGTYHRANFYFTK
jgi:hypothetical protein